VIFTSKAGTYSIEVLVVSGVVGWLLAIPAIHKTKDKTH